MSSKTDLLGVEIDQITISFNKEFSTLSAEQLNWKPRPEVWSVAQNIHHLITVNRSYFPVIESVRKGEYKIPFWGRSDVIVDFLGKSLLKYVGPETKRKTKTFPVWQPSASMIEGDIVSRFENHQSELIGIMKSCKDLISRGVVIRSPGSRMVVYKLEKAFEIIVAHEQRHLIQARNVLKQIKQRT